MSFYSTSLEHILPHPPGERFPGYSASLESRTTLEWLAQQGIYPAKEKPYSEKNRYGYHCPLPGHEHDQHPSFWLHSDGVRWKCFPCREGGGLAKLKVLMGGDSIPRMPWPEKAPKPIKKQEHSTGCTLTQLGAAKGLPPEFLKVVMGWEDYSYYGMPSVRMPYEHSTQLRVGLTGNRFRWLKTGNPETEAYNAKEMYKVEPEHPDPANHTILVVEGTTDCAAAKYIDLPFPVRGLPGTGTWNKHTAPQWTNQLAGWDVVLYKEPGSAGEKLAQAMAEYIPTLRIIDASITGYKDLCELVAAFHGDLEGACSYVESLIADAEPYYKTLEEDVVFTVDSGITINLKNDKSKKPGWKPRRSNTRPSSLWDFCCETFPDPPGVKPLVKSHILYSEKEKQGLVCDLPSNTWANAANAAFKKRKLLYHSIRKLSTFEALYVRDVAVDDWSQEFHDARAKAVQRADGQYLAIDNQLSRGCWAYLSTVPLEGFTPLEDVSSWLVASLGGIRVPTPLPQGQRFRPIRGSHALTKGCDAPIDEDRGRYQVVAESNNPTDWALLEAELRVSGRKYEHVEPVYRAQYHWGIKFAADSLDEVREFALGFGGVYQLRKRFRSSEEPVAAGMGK
jgi:hypothetical protein